MPVHLALVALSVLAGAWFAGDAPVSSQQVLLLGVASGLTGLLLGRGPRLRALCCCICALCAGTTSTRALPTGPQLEGWTHAVGEIVRRHDGWLVLETSAGPIALSGVDAGLGETAAVFGRARPLQITPASTWSREKGALHAGIRTVVQVKRQAVLDPRSPSPFLHSQHRAFLDRVVLGRSTPLSEDEEALLRSTGTRHLLAISGLHVGLISALGALVLGGIGRVLALFWRPRSLFLLPAIGGCTAALLYASNAGFPTSTIRALCVLALGWGCWLIGRTPRPWRLFWLALTLTVLFAPQRVKTLSFGLSFSAAAGVLQSLAWTKKIPPDLHPVVRWLLKAMSVRLGAQLGTLAWSAWVFQELPLLGAFANLVAVPMVGVLILPAGLLSSAGVPGAASLTEGACEVFWAALALLQGPLLHPAVGSLGALGLLGAIFCMRQLSAWLPVCVLCLGLKALPAQGLTSTHFDVGQGDASLVEIAGETQVLIDAGPREHQVLHALRRRGIRRLDALILSHDHFDHSAGLLSVLRKLEVGCLLLPDPVPRSAVAQDLAREAAHRGVPDCNREHPAASLRALQLSDTALGVNDRSLVIEASHAGQRFLYLGDLEAVGERLSVAGLQPAAGLKIAHHGSRGSTTSALLYRVQPDICVISSGRHNRYGHPHSETLDRLKNCEVHQTAENGDVVIYLPPESSS